MKNNNLTIPKGWEMKKIKDLLDYERPDAYIVKSTSYTDKGKIPVLTANKSFILGYTNEDFGVCENIPAIIFDDFTTDSKYVNFPFKIKSSAIKILRSKSEHPNLRYIFELIKFIKFPVGEHKRYYISEFQDIDVAVPPWDEQKKIIKIISSVDDEIHKTDEIISQTVKIKKGLMQELFTKGIGHKKFKKTKIGEIPEEWEVKTINDLVVHVGSGATPRGGSTVYLDKGIPFIRSQNVYFSGLRKDELVYIPKSTHADMRRSNVNNGDVLLNITGASIGRACVVPEGFTEANVNQHVCIIRPNIKLNNFFLFYFLQSKFGQDQIFSLQTGSNREGLNFQNIRSFKIMLPLMQEQKEISDILFSVDDKITINKKFKEKLTTLKKGLMGDLLSGKVRVK
jgi:restriction endonuclease S subunit